MIPDMQKTKSRSGNASRSNDCDRCASCVDDVTLVDDVDTGGCFVILIGRKRNNYIPCTVYYMFPYMQYLHAHLHILSFSPRCRAGRLNDAQSLASRRDVTRRFADVSNGTEAFDDVDGGEGHSGDLRTLWRRFVRYIRRQTPEVTSQTLIGSLTLAVVIYCVGKRVRRALGSNE